MMKSDVHIIGGGIIGLCSAWYLAEKGHQVTILDKGDFKEGTSFGNAGMIVPSHFIPLAAPGVISQGVKWMFDRKSPFYIKPKLDLELVKWIWRFYKSSNAEHVRKSMPILFEFNEWSKQLYREFSLLDSFNFGYEEKGLLMLYKSVKQEKEELEMAEQANELGIEAKVLNSSELKDLEPEMEIDAKGAVYFPGDAHLYPNLFINQLIIALKQKGVEFTPFAEVTGFTTQNQKINNIILKNKEVLKVENVVITIGSWSSSILRKLDIKMLLEAGKGYSITMESPAVKPRIPTILTEAKVAITPMLNDLRIGGTLELGSITSNIDKKRLAGIIDSIPRYYKNLSVPNIQDIKPWVGYRPCSPDGMPYIGRHKAYSNLIIGTGHGMMGMSLGAATGKLISQMFENDKTNIPSDLFAIDRF